MNKKSQNNSMFSSIQMKYVPQNSDEENLSQPVVFKSFRIVTDKKKLELCPNENLQAIPKEQQEPCNYNNQSQFTQMTLMGKNDIQFSPINNKKKKIKKYKKFLNNSESINSYFKKREPGQQINLFTQSTQKFKKPKQSNIKNFMIKQQRKKQTSKFAQLSRDVMLKIMMYLRLGENITFSKTSLLIKQNYRLLWYFGDYFKHLDSKNFTSKEIDFVRQKSRYIYSQVLNTLLRGRQTQTFFKKNFVKLVNDKHNITEIQIKPNRNGQIPQIYDDNLGQIFQQSNSKLKLYKISLENCGFLRKFFDMFNEFINLHILIVTRNSHINDNQIYQITTQCKFLKRINLSFSKQLTEQSLTSILSHCTLLETLNISGITKIFEDFNSYSLFKHPVYLQKLNISYTEISFTNIKQILQNCQNLTTMVAKKNFQLTTENKTNLQQVYPKVKFIF